MRRIKIRFLVLLLVAVVSVMFVACDGSVENGGNNNNDSPTVYVPQFQLTPTSKAITMPDLTEYFDNDGMMANNALVVSMQLPSLIGFEKTTNTNPESYTQTILGKAVTVTCTKNDDGSYIYEGTTTDDSIYIRTVVKDDNTVDYLEMKKVDVNGDGSLKAIFASQGFVTIDPTKDYQIGTVTGYMADNTGSYTFFNNVGTAQFYLSNTVTASVADKSQGYAYDGIANFNTHYNNEMSHENVLAFIADVSAVSIHYPGSGLNLAFHLLESSIYAQNIYKDGGVYCLPTSSGGSNSYATDWDDMQGYVSFLTGNKWTLIH